MRVSFQGQFSRASLVDYNNIHLDYFASLLLNTSFITRPSFYCFLVWGFMAVYKIRGCLTLYFIFGPTQRNLPINSDKFVRSLMGSIVHTAIISAKFPNVWWPAKMVMLKSRKSRVTSSMPFFSQIQCMHTHTNVSQYYVPCWKTFREIKLKQTITNSMPICFRWHRKWTGNRSGLILLPEILAFVPLPVEICIRAACVDQERLRIETTLRLTISNALYF